MNKFSENTLIEMPALNLFSGLGWETADCFEEVLGADSPLGRETTSQVLLPKRLLPALRKLNPTLPEEALASAFQELERDRSLLSPARANQEVYHLLKDGVKVSLRDKHGREQFETVRLVDWELPENNDFFLASQMWVSGDLYKRRPDLIGFVNGIPLLFVELKAAHKRLENAYQHNLRDYRDTIPQLFWYNALVILSNGADTVVGSMTAPWEHFAEWKKINSEGEEGIVSLETAIRGLCEKSRFLDMVENFTLFAEMQGGLQKLVAKNHQYLGVNNALQSIQKIRENQGRLGVFWHTQGSGKSYSMILFAQKVLRKLPGNWTFVVITDRHDLDNQIYKNFANVGAVYEPEEHVRAQSGEHLKQLLREDHRYVFTLIHKFHTESGKTYPLLSERSDIIVLTDEAHRTQYDVLALNMRNALPNAAFLAFTGTPLIVGEEKTRQVFGDYVSIYNFAQSVADNATVPLYYENRIPELQLTNEHFKEDMEQLLEEAELDENQEAKLEREFSHEYHLITREERLEKIAEDIVLHFMGRGFQGKAMVVSIDKATALKMYTKVQKYWNKHLVYLMGELDNCPEDEKDELTQKINYMRKTDMAVVISQAQNEIDDMRKKGLDIEPHRRRLVKEDLDTKFKDANDPLRIVFVCAMWMTGFDVPSCSTIYLDKPMRNHTLMQTIARANRVFRDKVNGLIVDYVGVFRSLQRALAIYGTCSGGGVNEGDLPVISKQALIDDLVEAIENARQFLLDHEIDMEEFHSREGLSIVQLIDNAVEAVLVNDDTKRQYLALADRVDRLFQAILPDKDANRFFSDRKVIHIISSRIRSLAPAVDITEVMADVENLLDRSVEPAEAGYVIGEPYRGGRYLNLSKINFDKLKEQFEKGRKRMEAEQLRGHLNAKLLAMIRLNKTRMDYYEKFQKMIEEYNSGVKNIEVFFEELLALTRELNEEEKRGIAENLSEEELTLFDLLTKPDIKLSREEKAQVKAVASELLTTLKAERLVLDWRKQQQTRAGVQMAIEETLDKLPGTYTKDIYSQKCATVYQHVYDAYYGEGKSIYESISKQ